MHTSEPMNLSVRRDLDVLALIQGAGVALHSDYHNPERLLRRYGGHREKARYGLYLPGEVADVFRAEIKMLTLDYRVVRSTRDDPMGYCDHFSREVGSATGVLVYPEEDWDRREVLAWMWSHEIRPASFYEHLAIIADHKEVVGQRVAVPFGGWPNSRPYPGAAECLGLLLVHPDGELVWNEGGAGYTKGPASRAPRICFTAVTAKS